MFCCLFGETTTLHNVKLLFIHYIIFLNRILVHSGSTETSDNNDDSCGESLAFKFATQYLCPRQGLVAICLDQEYSDIDSTDRQCIEECLVLSSTVIANDIHAALETQQESFFFTETLALLFDKDNTYYKTMDGKILRNQVIDAFQMNGGFVSVSKYLSSSSFLLPSFAKLQHIADAVYTLIVVNQTDPSEPEPSFTSDIQERRKDAVLVGKGISEIVRTISLEELAYESFDSFEHVLKIVWLLLRKSTCQSDLETWQTVNQDLILKLLTCECDRLKELGWGQALDMLVYVNHRQSPAKTITVSRAGCSFVNGTYSFSGIVGKDGYATSKHVRYQRIVPAVGIMTIAKEGDSKAVGKYHWSIASKLEMDLSGERSGSLTYYEAESIHKSTRPPASGWTSSTSNPSDDPPPTLRANGSIAPLGKEHKASAHEYAKWIVANHVLDLAFEKDTGNGSLRWAVNGELLMEFLAEVKKGMKRNDSYLEAPHVLMLWRSCVGCDDSDVCMPLCYCLANILPLLPDDITTQLLEALHKSPIQWRQLRGFFVSLISMLENDDEDNVTLSMQVQTKLQKLSWRVRGEILQACTEYSTDISEELESMRDFEIGCSALRCRHVEPGINPHATRSLRKATVSVLDYEKRLIRVSLPIELGSGEYLSGMLILASCEESKIKELNVGTICYDNVEQCLLDGRERATIEIELPEARTWDIEWQGMLLRKEHTTTKRSPKTSVDLTLHTIAQEKKKLQEIASMDENAKRHAGDIQGALLKLRGPCSSQLDPSEKFTLLHTATTRGRSTLKGLESIIQSDDIDESSIDGIARLKDALATASPLENELERTVKSQTRKRSTKEFKAQVTPILASSDALSWLATVTSLELDSLGGDPNRLYQLLIEGKYTKTRNPAELDRLVLQSASKRTDLFSEKQIKSLVNHCKPEADFPLGPETQVVVPKERSHDKLEAKLVPSTAQKSQQDKRTVVVETDPPMETPKRLEQRDGGAVDVENHPENVKAVVPTPVTPVAQEALLRFLQTQLDCLKCTPEAFYEWLLSQGRISSVSSLAAAVTDDVFFNTVLLVGEGSVGIKKFKRFIFQEAVLAEASREWKLKVEGNKENADRLPDLFRRNTNTKEARTLKSNNGVRNIRTKAFVQQSPTQWSCIENQTSSIL